MSAGSGLPGVLTDRLTSRRSPFLFDFAAEDLSLTPRTGQAPTFARASVGSGSFDLANRMYAPIHSQPAWTMVDTDGDGVRDTPALMLDTARTNLCFPSEDFSGWTAIGTPVRSAGFVTLGLLSLDALQDDAAGTLEGYFKNVAFGANAVRSFLIFYRASTLGPSVVRLRDTTAGADRFLAVFTPNGSGIPTPTVSTGAVIRSEFVGFHPVDGSRVYCFHCQTTAVTSANTNRIEVYPATTAALAVADQGSTIFGGVQAEDAAYPSGYVKTVGGTVARARDALTYQAPWAPRDETWYFRFARPIHADVVGTLGAFPALMSRGNGTARIEVFFANASRNITVNLVDASGGASAASQAVPAGAILEVCAQIINPRTSPQVRIDVGAGFGNLASGAAAIGAYSSADLFLGDLGTSLGNCLGAPLIRARIAAGQRTMAQMRVP